MRLWSGEGSSFEIPPSDLSGKATNFGSQTRLDCSRRDGLLLPRRHPHLRRRLQVKRIDALLQRPRNCQRTLGSKIHSKIRGEVCEGRICGARCDEEAEEDLAQEG